MLKGIQKNMIMVRLPRSQHFETAYFVIRATDREAKHGEMVKEANKIISDARICPPKGSAAPNSNGRLALFFVYGLVSGAMSVSALWLGYLIFA